jgi:hypothetical protein
MINNSNMNIQHLPDDVIRCICAYLTLGNILRLERVSKRFNKVKKYITYIKFDKKIFTDKEYKILCNVIKESSLKKLHLNYNRIRDAQTQTLINYLPQSLQTLNLNYNSIGGDSAKGLRTLIKNLPISLQKLCLRSNKISNRQKEISKKISKKKNIELCV